MSFSLYEATIPTYLQILGSVSVLVDKAEAWCRDQNTAESDLIQASLAPDMLPFAYQISSCYWHSAGAIQGVRAGVFSPDSNPPPTDFSGLKAKLGAAIAELQSLTRDEVNGLIGQAMRFEVKDFKLPFAAEDFLLSFSQPNFYFHATTAYDILRWKGLAIGKMDFIGALRMQTQG